MIYTKQGEPVTDIAIDPACFFDTKLVKVHGTVANVSKSLWISDLKGDEEGEVQSVVEAVLNTANATNHLRMQSLTGNFVRFWKWVIKLGR